MERVMGDKPDFWSSTPGTQTVVNVVSIGAVLWQLCPLVLYSMCQQGEGLPTQRVLTLGPMLGGEQFCCQRGW